MENLTRRSMIQRLAVVAPVTAAFLLETGCASLANTLTLIVDTANAAVDIAFPQYAVLLDPYFTAVGKFIDQTTTELATSDTAAMKAAAIAGYAAAIVTPNLSGVAQEVVSKITQIAALVAKLIDQVQGLSAAIDSTPGGANAFFAAHKSVKTPSAAELAKIKAKNAALKAKLHKK